VKAPRLIVLAGPNGSGKSTFFEAHLRTLGLDFVNADRVVAALGIPANEAAEAADALRGQFVAERKSYITETVFSDPVGAKLQLLRDAIAAGYEVTLLYIGLASPALSEARVAQRVAEGGHDVPTERLARRYAQSLQNLVTTLRFVPEVLVFDNSSSETPHRLVLSARNGVVRKEVSPLPPWLKCALPPSGAGR